MISVRFQSKPFNITVIQVYAPTSNAEDTFFWRNLSWMVLWRPTRPSRTNTQKRCLFHHRGLEWKSRKSKDTWNNRQVCLEVQNEGEQMLTGFCQKNTLIIANTLFQQHNRRLYTMTLPDGQYWNQIDHLLCSQKWRSSIQSADCGSDHELLIAKFRLKLKR